MKLPKHNTERNSIIRFQKAALEDLPLENISKYWKGYNSKVPKCWNRYNKKVPIYWKDLGQKFPKYWKVYN